jgi:hypothetical protein
MSLTASSSAFAIGVLGLFPAPVALQGYDVDDAFTVAPLDTKEVKIGVDGVLSVGIIYQPITIEVHLQGDSLSVGFFEAWYNAEQAAQQELPCFATIRIPSLSKSYTLPVGYLKDYSPISSAKKILQPRPFSLVFQPPAYVAPI